MRIIFFGKGIRAVNCLIRLLKEKYNIILVVGDDKENINNNSILKIADENDIKYINPKYINSKEIESFLKNFNADIFILGGYGKILKDNIITIPRIMCINLHGGKLPDYRGSSPMNWSLINGGKSFFLSIIKVDKGVDTGPIIYETKHNIGMNDSINDLHKIANNIFPDMLCHVLEMIKINNYKLREQKKTEGSYYPLRFPDDGFILFDQLTAEQIHNRIRALTNPYPCAFTFFKGRKVKLISSKLHESRFYGEPGRVYVKNAKGLLVCAKDRCLWITNAVFEDNGNFLNNVIKRYEKLLTVNNYILELHSKV